ncbi:phenylalanine--tRNA ligase subunit beta [Brachymonas sp. G13]|uniref:phenylalanine--tRNA ligase subunit beta n=1 Tax=Brachymonas TaxID=28219 RepID=UPI002E76C1C1|nr:phenylalanine--tRNA ligase subunit beta [Brachymonas sp. J145]MEE1654181.1 phenylalanine--tRNA ligase subunit beta [Brachymonas sp. J145]
MQFPESWLRQFCNPPLSTEQLADTLTMAGLEVEELRPVAPPFTSIVVAEIKEAEQHPDADRLRVCKVDAGTGELLQIVCGAPNARPGIKIPCAMVGAELPPGEDGKPFKIKVGKLRGVQSFGMLCSSRELGLSDDHGGLLELPADAPVGQDIREYLDLDDTLFTLKLTPNLAHCLSVYGIAREVSALTGAPLQALPEASVAVSSDDAVKVTVEAPELCGRFSGRVIRGVNTEAATPGWMVDRLARCGQRSVSALVDISNYVMFELGQPSHIFDRDKIHGSELNVRWGREGEQLKLLNGNTVALDSQVGVIADAQEVESLAGIMGGDATAVGDDTQNVYVEVAFWWPKSVAGRSRRYNFSTDAGHRYERGVDPARTLQVVERISQLILEICGGEAGPASDVQPAMPQAKPVTLRVDRASKVIGMPVTAEQCLSALRGLGLPSELDGNLITVTPPSYRFDLSCEEDLIEEVIRIIGYDNLPTTPPQAPITPKISLETQRNPFAVRRQLAALGYQETINYSFVEERWERELAGNDNPIRLLNPIASQMSVMRTSLIGSLLNVVKFNLDRKASRVRVFEVGHIFLRDDSVVDSDTTVAGFNQPMRVAGMAYGALNVPHWGNAKEGAADFYDAKGDVEALLAPQRPVFEAAEHPALHPGRCARILLDGRAIGVVGELHPRWRQAYELPQAPVLFELDWEAVLQRPLPHSQPVPKYQAAERDIAVIVKESVTHDQLIAAARAAPTQGLLRSASVFDIFRAKAGQAVDWLATDEKSVAIRLLLQNDAAALTDEALEQARQAVLNQLISSVGARQRG